MFGAEADFELHCREGYMRYFGMYGGMADILKLEGVFQIFKLKMGGRRYLLLYQT